MNIIHSSAIIEEGATLGAGVTVGAYCVIGKDVKLADGVRLVSHVSISGHTSIGEGTVVYPFASLGHPPQDLKFKGEASRLEIGKYNTIREHVTMNPGTEGGGMLTKVGDQCLFMVATHVAHDCQIGNRVIMANNATLAGHVVVGDGAIIGGLAAVHQFVRIGEGAMIGGMSGVEADVIPFGMVMGERAHLAGLNLVGLKRRDLDREQIHALRNSYKALFQNGQGVLSERIGEIRQQYAGATLVQTMLDFLESDSSRSFCVPKDD